MQEIEQWIEAAIKAHSMQILRLPRDQAREIVADTTSKFVSGRPRSWWLNLKVEFQRVSAESLPLSQVVPMTEENAFFIAETEETELPVYRGSVAELEQLIRECPFFEYYVVAPDMRWLVIESDHNVYFLCGVACGPGSKVKPEVF